ncbi:MAG: sulfatase [Phycisphaerales bacterium]|nr:sulfatase [Phycisphaerales bacterium]
MPPNLVFVFADQLRSQAMGYAGDRNAKTPFLDRLAGESLNFVNAVSNCPICTPYRACLLTGQYPLAHGLFMNDLCLRDNGRSLGQELKRGGYETAWIGKWHLDGHGRSGVIPRERRQGFDYWKTLECTHDYNHSHYYEGDSVKLKTWAGYDAYAQTDDAVAYFREHNGNVPFALFLSLGTPHDPYDSAPEELKRLFPAEELVLRRNVPPELEGLARRELCGYYAHLLAIDRCVEKIDAALVACGLAANTILVFTSDHGDMLESHGCSPGTSRSPRKQVAYEESVSVPFLLRYPDRFSARHVTASMATPDIMPMLLGLCGLSVPECVEGVNVLESPERMGVLIASYSPFADHRVALGGRPYRGVRTPRYTFVRDLNGPWMLFDRETDPLQLKNVVGWREYAGVQAELDAELGRMLREQNDLFERPEELLRRYGYAVNDRGEIPYF